MNNQSNQNSDVIVPSTLYDEEYYLTDNDGFREFQLGLDEHVHDKFQRVLKHVHFKEGDKVLDIGCGRGELIYYAVKNGAYALGLDYSQAAVNIAKQTMSRLPQDYQSRVSIEVSEVEKYPLNDQYDYIFMVETAEHMYDWQLEKLFKNVKKCLKSDGIFIMTTPNYLYERYFEPTKRFLDIPFKMIKYLFRIPRGKYKPASVSQFFKDTCRIKVDRGEKHLKMHCNISTRKRLRRLLSDFDAHIFCEDHSINPLSLLLQRWFGRYIIGIARQKN